MFSNVQLVSIAPALPVTLMTGWPSERCTAVEGEIKTRVSWIVPAEAEITDRSARLEVVVLRLRERYEKVTLDPDTVNTHDTGVTLLTALTTLPSDFDEEMLIEWDIENSVGTVSDA